MINRRTFFTQAALSLSLMALPKLVQAGTTIRRYQVTANIGSASFAQDDKQTSLWLYNNTNPGPLLKAKKGEILEVEFINKLDQPTTIHWHGIRNLNEMDGVPELTQAAVEPGDKFTYRFPVNDAGTFWYHAHSKSWEQVARGLYGALIILDDDETFEDDRDHLIVADDWLLDENGQIDSASLGSLGHWSHGGRLGNTLTTNGSFMPTIEIAAMGQVRLRLLNTANARILSFTLNDGLPMKVVSVDGSPCKPFEVEKVTISPAQRVDVVVEDCAQLSTLFEISTGTRFEAADFIPAKKQTSQQQVIYNKPPYYNEVDNVNARLVEIHMQGGAMGNLASALFEGEERGLRDLAMNESKLWAFNGQVGGYNVNLADVNLGDVVSLRVWNDTAWPHAMHLHGQHFWVKSGEFGQEEKALLRDTYLMQPGEKKDLIFIADNPGLWLFHCHMLEHHAAGMAGVISVS
jgi:FtsP/CotA-like multicopper oxidase with cupredoxin domain